MLKKTSNFWLSIRRGGVGGLHLNEIRCYKKTRKGNVEFKDAAETLVSLVAKSLRGKNL